MESKITQPRNGPKPELAHSFSALRTAWQFDFVDRLPCKDEVSGVLQGNLNENRKEMQPKNALITPR